MKLFIWYGEGVLQDWKSGQITCIAPDLEAALKTIEAECDWCMESFPNNDPSNVIDFGECSVPVENMAWITWGGG